MYRISKSSVEGSKGVRDVVGFGGGSGPLRHLGEGADRKGECLDQGVSGIRSV